MKFSDAYKGSFLKAADLDNKTIRRTIKSLDMETIGDDGKEKVVARFKEDDQGFVLNKTNASILAESLGDDMDGWVGRTILLRPDKTQFNGKMVPCIRVAIPAKKAPAPVVAEEEDVEADDINV